MLLEGGVGQLPAPKAEERGVRVGQRAGPRAHRPFESEAADPPSPGGGGPDTQQSDNRTIKKPKYIAQVKTGSCQENHTPIVLPQDIVLAANSAAPLPSSPNNRAKGSVIGTLLGLGALPG